MNTIAIILTLNEEIHLARWIENIQGVVDQIIVVDSHSSDTAIDIGPLQKMLLRYRPILPTLP